MRMLKCCNYYCSQGVEEDSLDYDTLGVGVVVNFMIEH